MSQEPLCTLRRGMERYRNGCKNKMYCNRCRTDVLRHYRFLADISPAERKGKRGHKGGNRLGDNPRRNVCRLAERAWAVIRSMLFVKSAVKRF